MQQIQPRITRRELQHLIQRKSWKRLSQRLAEAPAQDIAAQWPGLAPRQQQIVLTVLARQSKSEKIPPTSPASDDNRANSESRTRPR